MRRWWSLTFREQGSGEGSGGGNSTTPPKPKYTSTAIAQIAADVATEPDLQRAVAAELSRNNNDPQRTIDRLLRAAFKARNQRNDVLAENARVAPLMPAQSDVLFRGDEAKAVSAIVAAAKKAGLSLADLAPKIETLPTIETENSNLKQEKVSNDAARSHKLNAQALAKAVNDDGKVLYQRAIQVTTNENGQKKTTTEQVWHVRGRDEKEDKGVVLTEYVDKHVFKSAITSGTTQSGASSSSVDWPEQGGSSSSSDSANDPLSGNLVDNTLKSLNDRAKAPSALDFAFAGIATGPHSGNAAGQDAQRQSDGAQRK